MKKLLLCMAIGIGILAIFLGSPTKLSAQQEAYAQCGGGPWTGGTTCISGYMCVVQSEFYSQCLPGTAPGGNCPSACSAGGCGASACSIKSPDLPMGGGGGGEKSVTAKDGYFACCYKSEWSGNTSANAYPDSCCPL